MTRFFHYDAQTLPPWQQSPRHEAAWRCLLGLENHTPIPAFQALWTTHGQLRPPRASDGTRYPTRLARALSGAELWERFETHALLPTETFNTPGRRFAVLPMQAAQLCAIKQVVKFEDFFRLELRSQYQDGTTETLALPGLVKYKSNVPYRDLVKEHAGHFPPYKLAALPSTPLQALFFALHYDSVLRAEDFVRRRFPNENARDAPCIWFLDKSHPEGQALADAPPNCHVRVGPEGLAFYIGTLARLGTPFDLPS